MTIEDKDWILEQEYKQPKESFNKKQEKTLKIIIAKQNMIEKAQEEIDKLFKENDLNILDLDKYKHDKNVDKFLGMKFPH